jgi:hypothetical protein
VGPAGLEPATYGLKVPRCNDAFPCENEDLQNGRGQSILVWIACNSKVEPTSLTEW